VQNTPTMLNAIAPDRTQAIRIQMDNVGEQMNAAQYLNSKFQNLQSAQYVDSAFGQAYTGVASVQDQRTGQQQQFLVSAVKRGGQAYVVAGLGQKVLPNSEFFEVAKNMRSLKSSEQNLAEGQSLKLITVQPGDTFSSLARKSDISEYPEETLRLVNGMYPDGELKAGQKLKLVR
jgi:predicted Zn-dependent protease